MVYLRHTRVRPLIYGRLYFDMAKRRLNADQW